MTHPTVPTSRTMPAPWEIRAFLDGRKTVMRVPMERLNSLFDGGRASSATWAELDFRTDGQQWVDGGPSPAGNVGPYLKVSRPSWDTVHRLYPHPEKGDRLWVAEAWAPIAAGNDYGMAIGSSVYRATCLPRSMRLLDASKRWRSAYEMPRTLARLELEIVSVAPELLPSLAAMTPESEAACIAEGLAVGNDRVGWACGPDDGEWTNRTAYAALARLWDAKWPESPWTATRWVWRYELRVVARERT